ncbi:hypothetical protein GCM10014719_35680 [Planomonospora parontospora subsp. antibiotica]|nr:hypothetical protein GCM10014719_35680 [Planomonospora parontospora subsp. antibiotica]GII16619.1 hypothetical protein Ppa05_33450 [Planomonospora parontospora subsp. antibiotica]
MAAGGRCERSGCGGPSQGTSVDVPQDTWWREFPGEEVSVPVAREWVRGLLAGRIAAPVLDDVLLLLSEVVTNAITHSDSGRTAGGWVAVRVTRAAGDVHVEVADGGSAAGAPAARVPETEDDSGRGLWLVDLLAAAWGWDRDAAGGSVWFRVAEGLTTGCGKTMAAVNGLGEDRDVSVSNTPEGSHARHSAPGPRPGDDPDGGRMHLRARTHPGEGGGGATEGHQAVGDGQALQGPGQEAAHYRASGQ